ncbi:tyrosine-type recombinase/integrase [Dactylosporangium sp. NPDC049525]|uniref:tyrosine-type recombinase/integrase n=1 Tax=Dactylosporangium sp. NPDC049525 TaxID=3154730 RepID=UPI00341B4DE3
MDPAQHGSHGLVDRYIDGAVARAIERVVDGRTDGPILRSTLGTRMDRHAATRRLKHLAATTGVRMPRMHPHMLRHTFVTTMLDAGVSLRDIQIAARQVVAPTCSAARPAPLPPRHHPEPQHRFEARGYGSLRRHRQWNDERVCSGHIGTVGRRPHRRREGLRELGVNDVAVVARDVTDEDSLPMTIWPEGPARDFRY